MRRVPVTLTLAGLGTVLASTALTSCGGEEQTARDGSAACAWTTGGTPAKDVTPPSGTASADAAVITTNRGTITVALDAASAPCTVTSFVSLAAQHYFDNTPCHRLTTADQGIMVLQCGDPTGTGKGGPGYTIPDELGSAQQLADHPDAAGYKVYPAGTVAMARTTAPDSGGSQFFLVHEDSPLPPDYTVFGQMDPTGLDVVRTVAADGYETDPTSGNTFPVQPVEIESVTTR